MVRNSKGAVLPSEKLVQMQIARPTSVSMRRIGQPSPTPNLHATDLLYQTIIPNRRTRLVVPMAIVVVGGEKRYKLKNKKGANERLFLLLFQFHKNLFNSIKISS